ncbi:MAG TPA: MgtC/SapB family protein [Candidatus Sulfotelmatobacter sp.]|nr:MgtC/SapB family protein [Candidatus Sulfotelmatobacter sp.]
MSGYPYEMHLLVRLVLAALCGAALGYERERHGRSAGLRTNLLVCVGAALFMVLSKYFHYKPGEVAGTIPVTIDTERIAAQIVSGIGFLGAGVILKERGGVRGLTTAATLWFNAGVGMACGAGMWVLPIFCTGLGLVSLTVMKQWEEHMPRDSYKTIVVECEERSRPLLADFTQYLATRHIDILNVNCTATSDGATYEFGVKGVWRDPDLVTGLRDLLNVEGVGRVRVA